MSTSVAGTGVDVVEVAVAAAAAARTKWLGRWELAVEMLEVAATVPAMTAEPPVAATVATTTVAVAVARAAAEAGVV